MQEIAALLKEIVNGENLISYQDMLILFGNIKVVFFNLIK